MSSFWSESKNIRFLTNYRISCIKRGQIFLAIIIFEFYVKKKIKLYKKQNVNNFTVGKSIDDITVMVSLQWIFVD